MTPIQKRSGSVTAVARSAVSASLVRQPQPDSTIVEKIEDTDEFERSIDIGTDRIVKATVNRHRDRWVIDLRLWRADERGVRPTIRGVTLPVEFLAALSAAIQASAAWTLSTGVSNEKATASEALFVGEDC